MKICIFTSAHLVNDIRVYKKELVSLLKHGYEVVYYTNKRDKNMVSDKVHNEADIDIFHDNLTIIYNEDYNEEKRFKRFFNSVTTFFKLDKSCETYHFHDPDLLITALFLKISGKKVIYDVHENYIHTIEEKVYIPKYLRKVVVGVFKILENFVAKRMDAIVCATPKITERFTDLGLKNVYTLNNFPFKDELLVESSASNVDDENILIYTGGITKKRGISVLIKALGIVNKTVPCKLVMAGQIYPTVYEDELSNIEGWEFVDHKGLLSRSDMAKELCLATAGLVLFLPEKNHIDSQPNKLFEYMSAKLPIVCSHFPLWEDFIVRNEIGLSADPTDAVDVANAIKCILLKSKDALMEMGEKGHFLVKTKYNWDIEEKLLVSIYKKLEGNDK